MKTIADSTEEPRSGNDSEAPGQTPFVPPPERSNYEAPKATIDPDTSKSWLKRALPILRSHRAIFGTSLVLSFVGLVLQVQIPNLLNRAIDNSIQHHSVPLRFYVTWILALGGVGAVTGYFSRLFLFKTAYNIEYDLRNVIYDHLTRMSFPFYDRVQSGQLILEGELGHPVGADVYDLRTPHPRPVQHRAGGVRLHAVDQRGACVHRDGRPRHWSISSGVEMRKSMFPVSWLIQARLADVATIVDENVNGVRVVKSFVAEARELTLLPRPPTGSSGPT